MVFLQEMDRFDIKCSGFLLQHINYPDSRNAFQNGVSARFLFEMGFTKKILWHATGIVGLALQNIN